MVAISYEVVIAWYSLVPSFPPQLSSLAVRITVRIRTASDDSYGGGLGTGLQVMHERSRICRFAHAKLMTFELIVEFSDAARA